MVTNYYTDFNLRNLLNCSTQLPYHQWYSANSFITQSTLFSCQPSLLAFDGQVGLGQFYLSYLPYLTEIFSQRPDASAISDPTIRSVAEKFLGVGETVFDMIQATAVNSSYFKRDSRGSR